MADVKMCEELVTNLNDQLKLVRRELKVFQAEDVKRVRDTERSESLEEKLEGSVEESSR